MTFPVPSPRYELRQIKPIGLELRDSEQGPILVGYAAVFDSLSHDLGGWRELVMPTAFNKTIKEANVVALFNHDPSRLLGRRSNGTLQLSVDQRGLRYEIALPDTPTGREVRELVRRGDLEGSSFGFHTIRDSWNVSENGTPIRSLEEVALCDVGPVTMPAYQDTAVAVRSLERFRAQIDIPPTEQETPKVIKRHFPYR